MQALNFCNLLQAQRQQLTTYMAWLTHGVRRGFAADLLVVLPGAAVMVALSIIYATLGDVRFIAALSCGLKCVVLVLVFEVLQRIPRKCDRIAHSDWRFEIFDMDDRHVDKVMALREETEVPAPVAETPPEPRISFNSASASRSWRGACGSREPTGCR